MVRDQFCVYSTRRTVRPVKHLKRNIYPFIMLIECIPSCQVEAANRGVPGVVFASLDADKYNFIAVMIGIRI